VKLVDLNILLYAVNRDAELHARAKAWLDGAVASDEPVAVSWAGLLGLLRLSTSRRVMPRPLAVNDAIAIVDWLTERAGVQVLDPGPEHWRILREILTGTGTAGNLTTDAHLAALAIENGAVLCSTDGDFSRFRGLRWVNPLD